MYLVYLFLSFFLFIQINIFSFDYVLIPINNNKVHWSLILLNIKSNIIEYYDSLSYESKVIIKVSISFLCYSLSYH